MSTVGHPLRHENFQKAVGDLFWSGKDSDLTITCGPYIYKVHRFIICLQWHHLGVAISACFNKPGQWVLDLPNDHPPTIHRVLQYLYTQDYDDDGFEAEWVNPKEGMVYGPDRASERFQRCPIAIQVPQNNIQVYLTAEKYGIPSLMSLAAEKLGHWARVYRRSVAFIDILEDVLTLELGAKSELRGVLVDTSIDCIVELIERKKFLELTTQFPDFGSEVLATLVKTKLREQENKIREQGIKLREQENRLRKERRGRRGQKNKLHEQGNKLREQGLKPHEQRSSRREQMKGRRGRN
ncbi:uncharacterized protein BO80DRAFT_465475 [Aspergillus ibericus CBS 121593]|uniref:Uncharacterized protein n=1 Tax=Aspergillus ibericus CBS 121593 TaxID=1448316 RepID=A0A395GZ28_9EURO|nr:hypothetical protein BO80DRAFT_465475 [Aspergillus ibericus CBS 121593]RAL00339.1 hypothetical protein BO80DRAFT_465475 [Aspergillus ibericus CBS 121593]